MKYKTHLSILPAAKRRQLKSRSQVSTRSSSLFILGQVIPQKPLWLWFFFSFVWNSELIKPPEKKMRGCKQRLGFINVISAIRNAGGRGVTSYHQSVLFWIIHFASGQRCTTKHVEVFYLSTRWWVCLSSKLDQRLEKQMELLLHRTALLSRNNKKKKNSQSAGNETIAASQNSHRYGQHKQMNDVTR